MQEEAVRALLARTGSDWALVQRMVKNGQLVESRYRDQLYFLRRMVFR